MPAGTEEKVAAHYGRPGLEAAVVAELKASGLDLDRLTPADLSAGDEFHLGWHPATVAFAEAAAFPRGAHLLDIGSGVGGPARHFASVHGCRVTGIDITPDFVAVANTLTRLCRLTDSVGFREASALALPFPDATFDGAYTIHVAMNVADKAGLIAEARRVLKPGATFAIYDVMRTGEAALTYPLPWADSAETSFVESPAAYRAMLEAAGFAVISQRDRVALVKEAVKAMRERAEKSGIGVGFHALRSPTWPERSANVMAAVNAGTLAPIELIARAV